MFIAIKRLSDNQIVVVRKDAVRYVEPVEDGVILHIDEVGEIRTDSYDIWGFMSLVAQIETQDLLREVA